MSYNILNYIIDKQYSSVVSNSYIVLHDTGNSKSTFQNEVDNMHNNWSKQEAYATFIVGGGGKVAQLAPIGKVAWAALDANPYSPVQIELSHAHDQQTFNQDYSAYIELARNCAMSLNIPLTLDSGSTGMPGIKSHSWCTDNYPSNGKADHRDPYSYFLSWGVTKDKLAHDLANGVTSTVVTPERQGNIQNDVLRVAIVNYQSGYGINAYNGKGEMIQGTNQKFIAGTSWQILEIKNNMYRVSRDEWLPREFIYDVHYVAKNKTGYQVTFMSKPIWEKRYIKGKIKDNNLYMVQQLKRVNGELWINFGGDQWSLGKYFELFIGTK